MIGLGRGVPRHLHLQSYCTQTTNLLLKSLSSKILLPKIREKFIFKRCLDTMKSLVYKSRLTDHQLQRYRIILPWILLFHSNAPSLHSNSFLQYRDVEHCQYVNCFFHLTMGQQRGGSGRYNIKRRPRFKLILSRFRYAPSHKHSREKRHLSLSAPTKWEQQHGISDTLSQGTMKWLCE